MYFASLADLWHMSGHGFYVWLAYGISLAVMIALVVYPMRKKTHMIKVIRQRILHNQEAENGDAT